VKKMDSAPKSSGIVVPPALTESLISWNRVGTHEAKRQPGCDGKGTTWNLRPTPSKKRVGGSNPSGPRITLDEDEELPSVRLELLLDNLRSAFPRA
jgi:hypothetical protein